MTLLFELLGIVATVVIGWALVTGRELSFHRKEQYDLNVQPWVCIHARTANASQRVFCLWSGGVQVGRRVCRWGSTRPATAREKQPE